MATTTLPRLTPRSSFGSPASSAPPTSSLPALPRALNSSKSSGGLRKTSLASTPRTPAPVTPGPRTSSQQRKLTRPPSLTVQSPSTPGTLSPGLQDDRLSPRRSISIASFPQPPRGGGSSMRSSLPSSPLATQEDVYSPLTSPTSRVAANRLKHPSTASATNLTARFSSDSGVGLNRNSVVSGGLSPPHSRSSSAQGSYSTQATTIDASPVSGDEGDRAKSGSENKGNVTVSVRVRPDGEESGGLPPDWYVNGPSGQMAYQGKDGGSFEYDNVFTTVDDNARVYESCAKRLVRRVMEGYHGTVFAYGMTGTGKTFSMQGITSSPGVIPLAITDIFSFIRETPHREFLLRVSYLEIYNEQIHDLLAAQPSGNGQFVPLDQQVKGEEIKLREDPKRGVYATPLKEEIVQSPTQLLRVIARGDLARRTGSTQFNSRSSRSHAVVQIVVESRDRATGGGNMVDNRRSGMTGGVRVSTLSLIDLAGSERAAENKERRTEGSHINRSLLALGNVIAKLSKNAGKDGKDKDGNYLPYRDSKLTRLLQPALSGDSLISILCTIAIPGSGHMAGANNNTTLGETLNTLKFAARAKNNLVSHAKKSDESFGAGGMDAGSRALLDRYRAEIGELRKELERQRNKEEEEVREREIREIREKEERIQERDQEREDERHGEQMLEIQLARTALKERIEHLNRLILCSKSSGVNSSRLSLGAPGHVSALSMRSVSLPQPPTNARLSSDSTISTTTDSGPDLDDEFATGTASLTSQVSALQSDLADRNRYIATLEKRLLHARSGSGSAAMMGLGLMGVGGSGEGTAEARIAERDREIEDLRKRMLDKDRMLDALREAARKRDTAEVAGEKRRSLGGSIKRASNSSSKGVGGGE